MATLATAGRISEADVKQECERLRKSWDPHAATADRGESQVLERVLSDERIEQLDLFDRVQLAAVLKVCRECRTMAEAGRRLFAVSRQARTSHNDSDRLKKYLARFGLVWDDVHFEADSQS
jgi:transcriptional regulatory protein RtcR